MLGRLWPAALALVVASGLWLHGRYIGASLCEARHDRALAQAYEDAQRIAEKANANERARLEAEAERDQLAKELEDAARQDPVGSPDCLPAGRVRRLNKF